MGYFQLYIVPTSSFFYLQKYWRSFKEASTISLLLHVPAAHVPPSSPHQQPNLCSFVSETETAREEFCFSTTGPEGN